MKMSTRPLAAGLAAILLAKVFTIQHALFPSSSRYGEQHIETRDMRNDSKKILKRYNAQRRYEDRCGFRRTNGY